jgi:hypothetical protein
LVTATIRSDEVGDTKRMPFFGAYTIDGKGYDFACVPKITSISSNIGSVSGQVIVIKGSGFSNILAEVSVTADEIECKVISSTTNEIKCEVAKDIRASRPAFNVGQAGLRNDIYDVSSGGVSELKANLETNSVGSVSRYNLRSSEVLFDLSTYPK